jgi:hypothetical protein
VTRDGRQVQRNRLKSSSIHIADFIAQPSILQMPEAREAFREEFGTQQEVFFVRGTARALKLGTYSPEALVGDENLEYRSFRVS